MPDPATPARTFVRQPNAPEEPGGVTPVPNVTAPQAAMAGAMAIERLAVAVERLKPAADTIHGLGDRLDKLCIWLTGKWPWIAALALLVLQRTVNAAPDELPKLMEGLGALVKGLLG